MCAMMSKLQVEGVMEYLYYIEIKIKVKHI